MYRTFAYPSSLSRRQLSNNSLIQSVGDILSLRERIVRLAEGAFSEAVTFSDAVSGWKETVTFLSDALDFSEALLCEVE